jgi:DNA-binding NarL/FixJ family response regulator
MSRHILLIDDDPLVVKVYAERMRHQGWQVAIARDGWEAKEEAQRAPFDMILLDIRLPNHNGIEILKSIRGVEQNAETPVHVLTSMSPGEEVDAALDLGAAGVFFKSSTPPEELVKAIEAILSGQSQGESLAFAGAEAAAAEEGLATVARTVGWFSSQGDPELDDVLDVYINPLLGHGSKLSRALGMEQLFACPFCSGQIALRLAPANPGESKEVVGLFVCSACGHEV